MSSPITSDDFDITNFSGDVCTQLRALIAQMERMKEWFAWAFDSNGNVTQAFKDEFAELDIGDCKISFSAVAPEGWLLADGREVSRTTYAALFQRIGTTYGDGDSSTTFNLPDARDLVLVGAGKLYSLAQNFGADTVKLSFSNMDVDHFHVFGKHGNIGDGRAGATFIKKSSSSEVDGTEAARLLRTDEPTTADGTVNSVGGVGPLFDGFLATDAPEAGGSQAESTAGHENRPRSIAVNIYIRVL